MEGLFSANSLGWAKSVDIMSKTNMLSNERKAEFRYYSERGGKSLTQSQRLADLKGLAQRQGIC